MYEWYKLIQVVVDEIDERIKRHDDEDLTLQYLARKLGYSELHTTRRFKELSGMLLRNYIRRVRVLLYAISSIERYAKYQTKIYWKI
jgi:AraC-like DNA-binding protein